MSWALEIQWVKIGTDVNAFLRKLKASQQEELNFQGMFFWMEYVNKMTISE